MTALKDVKKVLAEAYIVDTIGRNKAGNIVLRKGFYYRNGMTADKIANKALELLKAKGIDMRVVETNEIWKPFRGGACVAQGSHFYVELA